MDELLIAHPSKGLEKTQIFCIMLEFARITNALKQNRRSGVEILLALDSTI